MDPTYEPYATSLTTAMDYFESYDPGDDESEGTGMCNRDHVRRVRRYYDPALFAIIFIVGILGNLLVVYIYKWVRNRLKTMTDVYLLNLAVADLLFLATLPFWGIDAIQGWMPGVALCKLVFSIYKINFFSSMFLLTCISVDRYIAIVEVIKAQNLKKKRLFYSKLTCLGVWVFSILLALPEFIFAQVKTDHRGQQSCSLVYPSDIHNKTKILVLSLQICMGFFIPLVVMIFCYSIIIRSLLQARNFEKHKALRVILVVVGVFVLSQLPYNSLLIMETMQAANSTITSCDTYISFYVARQVAQGLAYTHACINPILYVFIGVRFRQDLYRILQRCTGGVSKGGLIKTQAAPKRPSAMSDSESTPALSL